MFLKDFEVVRPRFEKKQEDLLHWIAKAHAKAGGDQDFAKDLYSLGLGSGKIQKRGYHLEDCNHLDWERMEVYNLESSKQGCPLDERMALFDKEVFDVFKRLYPEEKSLPSHLIHTTCTGYVAPSPAQKLVSLRQNGERTMVTHAYHMGCYGALPSIRMARGHFLAEKEETDIVHTEFCSLHMNPTLHSKEQLVVQSLFADGSIKYTVGDQGKQGLKILALLEEIIPETTSKMTWDPKSWGFQMSISKDIPILLRRSLEGYLERLKKKAKIMDLQKARYAIHPGGPKIIEQIGEKLKLNEEQMNHSCQILQNYGNMSSATLPHIWERMIADDQVKDGELIVSMAFGPGLSISGAVFQKRC